MIKSLTIFILVTLSLYAAVAASSTPPIFHFLIIRDDCVKPFFVDFSWLSLSSWTTPSSPVRDCVIASVSKALGYGIILGSFVVKLPQVINIVQARSGAGLSLSSQYQELASNALAVVWHVSWNASPFSAYGETIIVTLGCALVILAMWYFERPSVTHVATVVAVSAAFVQLALASPSTVTTVLRDSAKMIGIPALALSAKSLKDLIQFLSQLTFWGARITQIIATALERSNGAQSPLTLVFNLAGTTARVFTSMREVRDPLQLAFTVFNVLLNGVLCAQWVSYAGLSGLNHGKNKNAKKVAKVVASLVSTTVPQPGSSRKAPRVRE